jgi:hypothetical protein
LAPAYGGALSLRADLDQIEALSSEREALWARLDRSTFLTLDEKRAAVGYGPLPAAGSDALPGASADITKSDARGLTPFAPRLKDQDGISGVVGGSC